MDLNEIGNWKNAVEIHVDQVKAIVEDRKTLKNLMEGFLKAYFNFDEIEFNNDFSKISLLWDFPNEPTFTQEQIKDFPFEWKVNSNRSDDVQIDIYPWGLKDSQ